MTDAVGAGAELRARRLAAGLTQRQLAERAGVPQPNVSAYESGRRRPAPETVERLAAALRPSAAEQLRVARPALLALAARMGLSDVRVFGSVARGDDDAQSDVDLLVHPSADTSLFDLAAFMAEAEELLGRSVDVVSDRGRGSAMPEILAEAVPL